MSTIHGIFVGDALGAYVEFTDFGDPGLAEYAENLEFRAGGTWNLLPGQVTDDSEMVAALLYALRTGKYSKERAVKAYLEWQDSNPFDIGKQTNNALSLHRQNRGNAVPPSQANGALPRAAALGMIYGKHSPLGHSADLRSIVADDVGITHGDCEVTKDCAWVLANLVSAAHRVGYGGNVTEDILSLSTEVCDTVREWIDEALAETQRPVYGEQIGWCKWVLYAVITQVKNRALTTENCRDAFREVISWGGDTDTIAACVGAVYGSAKTIPKEWWDTVLECTPKKGDAGVLRPRPEKYWARNVIFGP